MKKFRSLLAILLSVMMVAASLAVFPVSAKTAPDVWDGTVDTSWYKDDASSFTITTAAQLAGFANLVNTQSKTFKNKTVKLGADIQLNSDADIENFANWDTSAPALSWTPIGYYNVGNFQGTFDGDGHTISGMYAPGSLCGNRPGLFGYVNGAVIKNLSMISCYAKGTNCVGIVAAFHSGTAPTFDNIFVGNCRAVGNADGTAFIMGKMGGFATLNITNVAITSSSIECSRMGGALLGYLSGGSMTTINIANCTVDLSLKGTYTDDQGSGGLIGMIGRVANPVPCALGTLNIIDTYVATTAVGNRDIGGLVGTIVLKSLGKFNFEGGGVWVDIDCFGSTCNIGSVAAGISYLRVLDVTDSITFKNMYVYGTVKCGQNSGGLIGRINSTGGTFSKINNITVDNVDMELDIQFKKGTGNAQCIGALLGLGQNNLNVVTINDVTTANTFTGTMAPATASNSDIGGLIGSGTCAALEVTGCTFNDTFVNCGADVGGFFGNAANTGTITVKDTDLTVSIEGTDKLGGLVGKSAKLTTITVTDSTITATLTAPEGKYAGAIAGTFGTALPMVSCTNVTIYSESTGNSLVGQTTEAVLNATKMKVNSNVEEPGIVINVLVEPDEGEACTCSRPDWSAWTVDKVMVCETGNEEDGHSYRVCKKCGGMQEKTIKAEHRFSNWDNSCTLGLDENGMVYATRVCAVCGEVEVSAEPMEANHKHASWVEVIAPTTTSDGEDDYVCVGCGTVLETRITTMGSHAVNYTDVEGTKYEEDIKFVTELGLFNGMGDGKFCPEETMTRGMIITVFARLADVDVTAYTNNFTDVPADSYYAPYVGWAQAIGLVNGYGDGTFRPDEPVTKEQAIAITERYLGYIGNNDTTSNEKADFTDLASGSEWAKGSVESLIKLGIVKGDETTLRPTDDAQRAELANLVANLVRYLSK